LQFDLVFVALALSIVNLIWLFGERISRMPYLCASIRGIETLYTVKESKQSTTERFKLQVAQIHVENSWIGMATSVGAELSLRSHEATTSTSLYWNRLEDVDGDELYYSTRPPDEYSDLLFSKIRNSAAKRTELNKGERDKMILAYRLGDDRHVYFPTTQRLDRKASDTHIVEVEFTGRYYLFRSLKKRFEINFDKGVFEEIDC
jgi:hypothetical protein